MKTRPLPAALMVALGVGAAVRADRADDAVKAFLGAPSPAVAASKAAAVVQSGVSFADAIRRLKQGRAYAPQPAGVVRATVSPGGPGSPGSVDHHYAVTVPANYDPARKYPVRFHLHGGVMMRHGNVPPPEAGAIGALASDEAQIYVVPFAWDASPWWSDDQLIGLRAILDAVKRQYNVDENRVVLSGVSDGGTGTYYLAMRDTTAYAAFLPLNGYWGVLANHDIPIDGPLFPNNLRDKPFFIVNGERDPLYPASLVEPAIAHYRKLGVALEYRPQAGAGHNTRWWPEVKGSVDAFTRAHPRDPLPDTLTWEASSGTRANRAHWLVIDEVAAARPDDAPLDDANLVESEPRLQFGVLGAGSRIARVVPGSNAERIGLKAGDALVRINDEPARIAGGLEDAFERLTPGSPLTLLVARDNAPLELSGVYDPARVNPPPKLMFDREGPSGRVDLVRTGNTVAAKTRGVKAFTLLLSPDRFDFAKPVKVVVNGRTAFEGMVKENVATLLRWAAVDNDRTMLFGAEIHLRY